MQWNIIVSEDPGSSCRYPRKCYYTCRGIEAWGNPGVWPSIWLASLTVDLFWKHWFGLDWIGLNRNKKPVKSQSVDTLASSLGQSSTKGGLRILILVYPFVAPPLLALFFFFILSLALLLLRQLLCHSFTSKRLFASCL